MPADRYVVSTAGRTGSHVVAAMIQTRGIPTVHTHYPWYKTDDDTRTGLVIVNRRDLFAAIMSNCLVSVTGQTTDYDQTQWPSVTIDRWNFDRLYRWHRWYSYNHELGRPWASVHEIYYEDFRDRHDHVVEVLGLADLPDRRVPYNPNFTQPAPYNYRDLVTNIDQCQSWFEQNQQDQRPVLFDQEEFANWPQRQLHSVWSISQ